MWEEKVETVLKIEDIQQNRLFRRICLSDMRQNTSKRNESGNVNVVDYQSGKDKNFHWKFITLMEIVGIREEKIFRFFVLIVILLQKTGEQGLKESLKTSKLVMKSL